MTIVIMLITFICGVIVLVTDIKNISARWLAAILFLASFAAFANVLQDIVPPFLYRTLSIVLSKDSLALLDKMNAFLTQIGEHFIGFSFFMYCLTYSGLFKKRTRNFLTFLFLGITLFSFFKFPIITNEERVSLNIYLDYYRFLALWSVPMVVLGTAFITYSALMEKNRMIRSQRIRNLIIILPIVISCILNLYLLRAFGIRLAWEFNDIMIIFVFAFFLFFAFRSGAMGVKFRLEKQLLLSILNNIFSGTAIFNHKRI